MMDESTAREEKVGRKETVWVGPAQSAWWRFQLGQLVLKLRTAVPGAKHVPGSDRATAWALDQVLGSRDVETTEVRSREIEDSHR